MRDMQRRDRSPRRIHRWRWPWRRPLRSARDAGPPAQIIQFPRRQTAGLPTTSVAPTLARERPPEQGGARSLVLAALVAIALVAGTAIGYNHMLQSERNRVHLEPTRDMFAVLAPLVFGRDAGQVSFHSNRTAAFLAFRYSGCPATAQGAFRLTLTSAADAGQRQIVVDRRQADSRTFRIDSDRRYLLSVAVPSARGCHQWAVSSNAYPGG